MKIPFVSILLLLAALCCGCGEKKARSFFGANGIKIGAPQAMGGEAYRIPIDFETEIVHSAQWIYDVKVSASGRDVFVTARFAHKESRYPDYIEIEGFSRGPCRIIYRDPDGTEHGIGEVLLP